MILNIFIQGVAGFIVTFAFAIFFNAPRRSLLTCSIIGTIGWLIFVFTKDYFYLDIVISTFLGSVIVGLLSDNAAKRLKMPATIFIYTGIIPLVPGYGVFVTMQNFVLKDYNIALKLGLDTVLQAGAIAVGILIAATFSDSIKRVKIQRKNK